MEEPKTEQISSWILEFLLRNPNLENIAKQCLSVLPIPADDPRLKKIVFLRTVDCEITDGILTESTLQALEIIEDLDSRRGLHVGDAMKAAYSAVAVELTVRFLVGSGGKPEAKYLRALQRIWRVRVKALEMSGERRSELLTGELRRWSDELEGAIRDDGVCQRLMGLNTRNDAVAAVRVYLKEAWVLVGKLFVDYGVKLRNEEEEKEENGVRVSREEDEPPDKGTTTLIGLAESTQVDFGGKGAALPGQPSCSEQNGAGDGVRVSRKEEEEEHPDKGTTTLIGLAELTKKVDFGDKGGVAAQAGQPSCSEQNGVGDGVRVSREEEEPRDQEPSSFALAELTRKVGFRGKGVAALPGQQSSSSLMDRNSSARTLEWDDSPEAMLNDKTKLDLPTPKKRPVSPLKKPQPSKLPKRRRVKRWTLLEEDTLRTAVQKFGKGNWKIILNSNRDVFEERTEVDLKDKWRNMTR